MFFCLFVSNIMARKGCSVSLAFEIFQKFWFSVSKHSGDNSMFCSSGSLSQNTQLQIHVLFLWLFGSKESAKMSCVLFWPVCLKRLLNTSHVLVFCFVSLKNIFWAFMIWSSGLCLKAIPNNWMFWILASFSQKSTNSTPWPVSLANCLKKQSLPYHVLSLLLPCLKSILRKIACSVFLDSLAQNSGSDAPCALFWLLYLKIDVWDDDVLTFWLLCQKILKTSMFCFLASMSQNKTKALDVLFF